MSDKPPDKENVDRAVIARHPTDELEAAVDARVRLSFKIAVAGPIVLGRGSHFGTGMFSAVGRTE